MKYIIMLIMLAATTYATDYYVQDYNNYLTRSIADDIYCVFRGTCTLDTLIVGNLTVYGGILNISVSNFNITGDINLTGCVSFPDGSFVCGDTNTLGDLTILSDLCLNSICIDSWDDVNQSGGDKDTKWALDNIYLQNVSDILTFNETKLNSSMEYWINNITHSNLDVSGNITADYFIGDGSHLTGIQQGSLILFFLDRPPIGCGLCANNKSLSTNRNDTEVTLTGNNLGDGLTLFSEWTTDLGVPSISYIPEGNVMVHVEGDKTGGTKEVQFFFELYKTNISGGNEIKLAESTYTPPLTDTRQGYNIFAYLNETEMNISDRIRVKGYAFVSGGGSAPSAEAYIQGNSNTRIELPVGSVSIENFVPYTGAVKDIDLGTHNLTTSGNMSVGGAAFKSHKDGFIIQLGDLATFYNTTGDYVCHGTACI